MKMEIKEIEKKIEMYIGKHLFEKEVSMVGNVVYVRLTYTDFLPEREVRNTIEDMIPLCKVESIERLYSDNTVMDELMKMYADGSSIGGVPLYALIEERLFTKAI